MRSVCNRLHINEHMDSSVGRPDTSAPSASSLTRADELRPGADSTRHGLWSHGHLNVPLHDLRDVSIGMQRCVAKGTIALRSRLSEEVSPLARLALSSELNLKDGAT